MTITVGIIGGGQLGLYLCHAAARLGLRTVAQVAGRDCPAAGAADRLVFGAPNDLIAASELAGQCDVVTFEIERIGPPVLKHLAARARRGQVRVAPSPAVMLTLQNKALQKRWLARHGFPTPPFELLPAEPDIIAGIAQRLGLPLVQKAAVGGYDGRGVQIIHAMDDLDRLWPGASVVEAFVADAREVAVLVARDLEGRLAVYPVTELHMDADDHVLETAVAPADIDPSTATAAQSLAASLVTRLGGVGVFAIEMFVTSDDDLLINEISPRVHNAGHLTLEACETSQFEQHVRAIAGMPLGPADMPRAAVMQNLLGTHELRGLSGANAFQLAWKPNDLFVHWYGKHDVRVGRKVGHVTALHQDLDVARQRCAYAARAVAALAQALPT
jgi:5-(carboxyamino)imidazole ribonucleotide synthase